MKMERFTNTPKEKGFVMSITDLNETWKDKCKACKEETLIKWFRKERRYSKRDFRLGI